MSYLWEKCKEYQIQSGEVLHRCCSVDSDALTIYQVIK